MASSCIECSEHCAGQTFGDICVTPLARKRKPPLKESQSAKERAEAHWNGYVGPMMETMLKAMLDISKFHYISSHVHGTKHGHEDKEIENANKEIS